MLKANGYYFDGLSSKPHSFDVHFDENVGVFYFEHPIFPSKSIHIDELFVENVGLGINLRNEKNSAHFVKIEDTDFITALNFYLSSNGKLNWYQKLININIKWHISIAFGIMSLIALFYIVVIPWIGEKSVYIIPPSYDDEIGSTFYQEYLKYNAIDSVKTADLNHFAKKLKLKNSKCINITVIESSAINAFALPDGNIIIFTGIIDQMESYDELVGLISHEVVHINERHSMKMLCRNLSSYLFISAVLSDVNGLMAIISDNVHNLNSLSYSRQFERQADIDGLRIMIYNQVNPKGMKKLFTRLKSEADYLLPEFLNSHPLTTERLAYIEDFINSTQYQTKENYELIDIFNNIKK